MASGAKKTGGESGFSTFSATKARKPDSPLFFWLQKPPKSKEDLETAFRPGKQAGNPVLFFLAPEATQIQRGPEDGIQTPCLVLEMDYLQ